MLHEFYEAMEDIEHNLTGCQNIMDLLLVEWKRNA